MFPFLLAIFTNSFIEILDDKMIKVTEIPYFVSFERMISVGEQAVIIYVIPSNLTME